MHYEPYLKIGFILGFTSLEIGLSVSDVGQGGHHFISTEHLLIVMAVFETG